MGTRPNEIISGLYGGVQQPFSRTGCGGDLARRAIARMFGVCEAEEADPADNSFALRLNG